MRRCHRCGAEWISEKKQPAVKDVCPECDAYLHCCLNCRFYELGVHNDCAIGTTDWVVDKENCNFCDEFDYAVAETTIAGGETADEARDTFQKLFGSGGSKSDKDRLNEFKRLWGE
jgi:hypothetical protein